MKRRDNKGFTLVELLAVITIIGIIAVISIVSVSKLIKKGKDEQKNSQLKTVEMAAESYSVYYSNYTDFELLSFGALPHVLPDQPVHPQVKRWLKESMGK